VVDGLAVAAGVAAGRRAGRVEAAGFFVFAVFARVEAVRLGTGRFEAALRPGRFALTRRRDDDFLRAAVERPRGAVRGRRLRAVCFFAIETTPCALVVTIG
jgi:hypothetical protein